MKPFKAIAMALVAGAAFAIVASQALADPNVVNFSATPPHGYNYYMSFTDVADGVVSQKILHCPTTGPNHLCANFFIDPDSGDVEFQALGLNNGASPTCAVNLVGFADIEDYTAVLITQQTVTGNCPWSGTTSNTGVVAQLDMASGYTGWTPTALIFGTGFEPLGMQIANEGTPMWEDVVFSNPQ